MGEENDFIYVTPFTKDLEISTQKQQNIDSTTPPPLPHPHTAWGQGLDLITQGTAPVKNVTCSRYAS